MHDTHSRFPLYNQQNEHDACGVGVVADLAGRRSNAVLRMALESLCNLTHRGAVSADTQTGDGAGVQTQIPFRLLADAVPGLAENVRSPEDIGVGMMFMPGADEDAFALCTALVEHVLERRGLRLFAWREVPVDPKALGDQMFPPSPHIRQCIILRPEETAPDAFERNLYVCRREIEKHILKASVESFYVCSMSCRSVVYKGMMVAAGLQSFYTDLGNPLFETAYAILHQRYSTNTFPTWKLAQPFRMLCHNGEINTIQGNRMWARAREATLTSEVWGDDVKMFTPLLQPQMSDSASLDNALELLTLSGRSVLHAMMMLVPEAWRVEEDLHASVKHFYHFHECVSEPWDGPAALVFSDGKTVGAHLDRNGLRPARYAITGDGFFVLGSEAGSLPLDDAFVIEKGRLGPGEIIAIDLAGGKVLKDRDLKIRVAAGRPYEQWLKENLVSIPAGEEGLLPSVPRCDATRLLEAQVCFGYSAEEFKLIFQPMMEEGKEPIGSMGDDAPIAILSKRPALLPSYFRQQFAQVTNPPIDPIRERMVMSLVGTIGRKGNWLGETPGQADVVELQSPVLFDRDLDVIRSLPQDRFPSTTFPVLFDATAGDDGLEHALRVLCEEAERAVDEGTVILILSDRDISSTMAPIPILLAVGAVHNHLLRKNKRLRTGIIAETGEPREIHHFATLIGYGANAVNPYLAYATMHALLQSDPGDREAFTIAARNFRKTIETGLLKVMSKMGMSVIGSYQGAHIFEALGIAPEVVGEHFAGTPSRIGGLQVRDIARESLERHRRAFDTAAPASVVDEGIYRFRRNGERHAWSPDALRSMQNVRREGDGESYRHVKNALDGNAPIAIKDLLDFKPLHKPVPLEEVEPVEEIRTRFTTAAMSLGSLSPEVHETIAIAMNRIGGKSNSGEGGEDPARFVPRANGDSANSAIKQIASARFGVTAAYIASAAELEIKMAQGSKPGEGGQIPGSKVTPLIASLRRAVPGTPLISPPPHHDIYSIEDLAQLIYDLKQVNPGARVCVKLVSASGVGTIAAGVAKAYADVILISGHDGGTGASPLSSVKNAGSPWELGLAEAQQVLVLNGLRERVTLRVDGGIKTGKDVLVAAMLGAEEFNFGTAALVALGCKYVRQCHLNTCPVGIATQDEELRKRFDGNPEMLIRYLTAVAQDVRELLAQLGFRSLEEVVGRTDLLTQKIITDHPKANTVDLGGILAKRDYERDQRLRVWYRNDRPDKPLDETIIADAAPALNNTGHVHRQYAVHNVHRSVGARLAGEVARRYGAQGLPGGTLALEFVGSAGQSFGAFLVDGIEMTLHGEANDYVGKGMSGGTIIVRPTATRAGNDSEVIAGNTILYGATGGVFLAAGRVGERFCVRNSGATAIVEGTGAHCCEYMTGGTVIVLGSTGVNIGAGMTGGSLYLLDRENDIHGLINRESVRLDRCLDTGDADRVRSLIELHFQKTASITAKRILRHWGIYRALFWKVVPMNARSFVPPATPVPANVVSPMVEEPR